MDQLFVQLNALASTSGLPFLCDINLRKENAYDRTPRTPDPTLGSFIINKGTISLAHTLPSDVGSTRKGDFWDIRAETMQKLSDEKPTSTWATTMHDMHNEGPSSERLQRQDSNLDPKQSSSTSASVPPRTSTIPQAYHSMLAGAGAGLVSSIVTCPLDVVKTRLQAQVSKKGAADYEGVKETISRIWKSAGVRGLYRGLGPTVLGYLPTWGIYFSVYDQIKNSLTPDGKSSGIPDGTDHWGVHIIAAMTAGATGTIVTNPLWLIRTRFMAQATSADVTERYTNTWIAFRSIYKTEGWRAFYRGLAPSLIGVTHVAVHFPLYEKMKAWAAPEDGGPLNSQRILVCSALSKMVASVITYPHEVLRTRLQIQRRERADQDAQRTATRSSPGTQLSSSMKGDGKHSAGLERTSRGLWQTVSVIAKQDGWKGFYRGISINLVRTVPASAVTMLTYELIMRHLSS